MNGQALPRRLGWQGGMAALAAALLMAACGGGTTGGVKRQDGNPSPIAGSRASEDANRRADLAQNRAQGYANAGRPGPRIIVLPGEIKSNNAAFTQRVTANNIADFAEIELTRANFVVLERSQLGALTRELELAYNLSDPAQAQRAFQKGKVATTRWIVKFDILKAEPVATSGGGFDGRTASKLLDLIGGSKAAAAGSTVAGSVRTDEEARVWNIGMRYKILDANSTEQVANGYFEDKMEVGATSTQVAGVNRRATGQLTLDSLVQRLVQQSVAEIDARYK